MALATAPPTIKPIAIVPTRECWSPPQPNDQPDRHDEGKACQHILAHCIVLCEQPVTYAFIEHIDEIQKGRYDDQLLGIDVSDREHPKLMQLVDNQRDERHDQAKSQSGPRLSLGLRLALNGIVRPS